VRKRLSLQSVGANATMNLHLTATTGERTSMAFAKLKALLGPLAREELSPTSGNPLPPFAASPTRMRQLSPRRRIRCKPQDTVQNEEKVLLEHPY
jgi:hypothetical protein